jgi:hypothetical protein
MTNTTREEVFVTEKPFETWFAYSVGPVCSEFLTELRDNKKILGRTCPECGRVLVPARPTCARCFRQTEEWREVGHTGTIVAYTAVYEPSPGRDNARPALFGIIRLDGADTGFVHMLGEVDPKELRIGLKVQAVFNEERKGDIRDIKYFKPLK